MSNFSFIFSFTIIFALFRGNHGAGLGACTPQLGAATGCQNDQVYTRDQCNAMFNPSGTTRNQQLCEDSDAWVTQALHCAETCEICCHRQQPGKNDPLFCGIKGGAAGKLGAEADVKKKCDDARKERNLIVYMSLNSTCPEYCDPF